MITEIEPEEYPPCYYEWGIGREEDIWAAKTLGDVMEAVGWEPMHVPGKESQ